MQIYENYVINSPERKRSAFRTVPFLDTDLSKNRTFKESNKFDHYLKKRFPHHDFIYTERGRNGIYFVLKSLNLNHNDIVTIFTTTDNFYISGCVTSEIEKVCKWSREMTKDTKVILVNHEFGYCYEELESLKKYNLPIIEDFAHSFTAKNSSNTQGTIGDFLIFSFSKFFPIQIGGLLVHKKKYNIADGLDMTMKSYLRNVVSAYVDKIEDIEKKRIRNYYYLKKIFETIDCQAYFEFFEGSVPGVFMFNVPKNVDLLLLKEFMNSNGVESSIFYGGNAYFIPSHQNLELEDLYYFFVLVKYFIEYSPNMSNILKSKNISC